MFLCYPLHLHLEGGERRFQLYSDEHDWFSPELTQNTRLRGCPNIYGGFNYSESLVVHNRYPPGSHYPPTIYIRLYIQCQSATGVMLRGVNPCENFDWPHLSHYFINCKTQHIKVEV